jgi:hypothetical protein
MRGVKIEIFDVHSANGNLKSLSIHVYETTEKVVGFSGGNTKAGRPLEPYLSE